MIIRFIDSPTGVFGLGYFVGDEVDFEVKKAKLLIESGFAIAVTPIESDPQVKDPELEPIKIEVKAEIKGDDIRLVSTKKKGKGKK